MRLWLAIWRCLTFWTRSRQYQPNKANFDATYDLEELLLEDNPLRPRERKVQDIENLSAEMRQLEEQFTTYDFQRMNRRSYYPQHQTQSAQITSSITGASTASRPGSPSGGAGGVEPGRLSGASAYPERRPSPSPFPDAPRPSPSPIPSHVHPQQQQQQGGGPQYDPFQQPPRPSYDQRDRRPSHDGRRPSEASSARKPSGDRDDGLAYMRVPTPAGGVPVQGGQGQYPPQQQQGQGQWQQGGYR